MSPVRFERIDALQGQPTRTIRIEHDTEFRIWFPDVKQALGLSSQELVSLSEQLDIPKQPRLHGPPGTIYYYSDEDLLRMAVITGKVEITRDEETGLTNLIGKNVTTTLSVPYVRLEEFQEQ